MAIFGNKRRKGVPRKKGKKRPPMSAATRKKISEALARRLGPTRGLDPYEKKGREPGKGNALPPNGVPGGGRRASEDFLVPDKIRKEPNYTTDLEDLKRKIIKDPKNGEKYLAKLKAAQKRAAVDTGDNGRNRSNQRLAVRMQTLADDAGLHAKVTTTDKGKGKGKGKEKGTKPSFDDRRKQAVDKTKNALDSGKNALGLGDKPVDTTLTDGTVQNKRVQTRMNAGKFEVRQTGVAVGRDGQIHNVARTETFDTQDEANKFARAAKKDHAGLTARDGSSDKQPIAAAPKDTNKSKGTGKGEGADTTPQKKQRDPNRGKLTQAARATEQARKQAQQAQQAYDDAVKAHPNWDHKKELDAKHKADQAYQRAVNREEKLKAQRSGETYNAEKWNRATRDRRNRETQDETARADKAMTDYADQLERNQQQREKQADEKAAKKERAHQSRAKSKAAKEKRHAEIQAKKEKAKANRSRAQKQRRETERRNKATDARDLAALRKDQEEIRNAEIDARDTAAMRKDLEDMRNAETDARDLAATRADLADMQAKEQAQEDADNWAELDAALADDAMANYDPNEVMDALNGNTTPETEGDNDLNKVVADLAEKQQRLDAVRQTQLDNPATTYPRWDDNTPHNPEKYRQARENYQHLDDGELEDALTQAADTLKKYGIDLSNPVEPQTPMNGDPDNDIPNAELRALYGRAKAIDAELFERRAEQADMFHPEHMVDATGYEPTTHDPAYWQSLMTQYDLDNSPRAYVAAMDKQQLERMETMDIVAPEIRDAINERLDYMDPERPGGVFDNALAHETLRNIKKVVEANPNLAAIGYDDSTLMAMAAIHGNPRQAFRKHVGYLDEYEEWQAHLMHSMYGLNGGAVWGDVAVSAAAGEFDVERNKYTNFDVLVSNPLRAKQLEEETLNHIEDRIGYLPNVPNFIRYKQGKAPIPFSRDSWKEAAKEGGRRRTTKADKAARELQKANQQILKEKLKDLKATPLQPLADQPDGLKTPLGTRGDRTALAFYDLKTSLGHEPTRDDYKRLVGGHAATLSDKDLKQAVRQAEQDARQNMGAREIVDTYNEVLAARGQQAKTPKPSKAKPRVKTTKHTAKPQSFEDYKRESDKRQHATEMRDNAATLNPVREEQRTKRRKAAETAARMAKVDATLKKAEGEEWENYKHQSSVKQQAREIVDMVRVTTPIMKEHRAKQEAAEKAKATPNSMPKKKATAKVQEKATPSSRKPARQPVMNGNTSGETKRPKHAPKVTTTAAKPAETAPAPTPETNAANLQKLADHLATPQGKKEWKDRLAYWTDQWAQEDMVDATTRRKNARAEAMSELMGNLGMDDNTRLAGIDTLQDVDWRSLQGALRGKDPSKIRKALAREFQLHDLPEPQEKTTAPAKNKRHVKGEPFTADILKDGETLTDNGGIRRGDYVIAQAKTRDGKDGYSVIEQFDKHRMTRPSAKSLDAIRKQVDTMQATRDKKKGNTGGKDAKAATPNAAKPVAKVDRGQKLQEDANASRDLGDYTDKELTYARNQYEGNVFGKGKYEHDPKVFTARKNISDELVKRGIDDRDYRLRVGLEFDGEQVHHTPKVLGFNKENGTYTLADITYIADFKTYRNAAGKNTVDSLYHGERLTPATMDILQHTSVSIDPNTGKVYLDRGSSSVNDQYKRIEPQLLAEAQAAVDNNGGYKKLIHDYDPKRHLTGDQITPDQLNLDWQGGNLVDRYPAGTFKIDGNRLYVGKEGAYIEQQADGLYKFHAKNDERVHPDLATPRQDLRDVLAKVTNGKTIVGPTVNQLREENAHNIKQLEGTETAIRNPDLRNQLQAALAKDPRPIENIRAILDKLEALNLPEIDKERLAPTRKFLDGINTNGGDNVDTAPGVYFSRTGNNNYDAALNRYNDALNAGYGKDALYKDAVDEEAINLALNAHDEDPNGEEKGQDHFFKQSWMTRVKNPADFFTSKDMQEEVNRSSALNLEEEDRLMRAGGGKTVTPRNKDDLFYSARTLRERKGNEAFAKLIDRQPPKFKQRLINALNDRINNGINKYEAEDAKKILRAIGENPDGGNGGTKPVPTPTPTPDGPRNRFAERLKKQQAELDTQTNPFAQREAKTLEEMQQRAQKRREQAQAAERRAQQAEEAAWGGTKLVPAEPMKAGARGARQRQDVNRAIASADKAVQARKDADKANERARASERALGNRYNPQTVANRVKRLQADIRRNGDSDGTKADELAYWQNVHKQNVADGKIKEAAPKPAAKGKPKATRKRPQKVGEKLVENDAKEGETFKDGTITRNGIGITNAKQRGYKGYDFTVPGRNEPVSDYFIQGRGPQNLDDARVMADRIAEDLKLDGVDPNNLLLGRPNDEVTASAKYGWGEDQEHAKALMAARENKGKGSLDKANQKTQKSNRNYGANLPDNVNPFTGDKRPEGKLASTDEEKKLVEIANTHSFNDPKRREAIKKLEANGIKYRLAASQQRFDELTKLAEEYKPTKAELNPNNEGLFFNDLGAWLPPRRNGLASIKFEPGDKPVNYLLAIDGNQYNITNVHTQHNGVKVLSGIDLQTGKKWTMKTNNMGTIDRPYTLRERPDRGADLAPQFWHARKDLNDTYPYVDDKDINGWSESGLQAARDSVTRGIAEKRLPETQAQGKAPKVTDKDVDLYVKGRFKGLELATSGTLDSLTTNEGSTLRELSRSNPTNSVYSPTMGEYLTQDSETNIVRDLAGLGDADNQQFANFKKSLLDDPDTRIIAGGDNGLTFMKPEKVEKFGYGYKITGTGDDGKRRVMKVQYDGYENSIELWHPLRHEDGTAYTKEQAAQFATIKAQTEQVRDLAQGNNDAAAVLYGASRLKELDAQRRKLHAQSGTQSTASEKVKKVQAEVDKLGVPDTAPKTKFGQRLQQQGAAMDAAKFDVTKVAPRDGEKAIRFEDLRPGGKGGSLTAKELDAVRAHAESLSNEDLIAAYGEARQQYNDAKGKGRVAGIRNAYIQEMFTRRLARGANNEMRPNHEPWPWGQGNEREEMRELRRTNLSEKQRKDTERWLEGRAENLLNQMVANGKDRETARKELEEIRRNTKLDPFGKDTTQKVDTPTSPAKTAKKQQAKAAQAKAAQDKAEREKMRATRDSELTVNGRTFTPVEDVFFEDGQQAYNNKDEQAILKFMNEPGYWATTADGTQVFTADKVKFYKNYATISGKTPDGKKAQQKVSLISIGYPLRRKEVTATPKGDTGTTPVKWARNDLQDGFNEDAEGYNINPNIDPQITRKIVNGEPRYYLNNQYGVIFTAIRNNTDFKVGQTLAGLIAADETSYPQIWVDKNGEGHAPRSIDPDARITIELVAARMARGKLPTQEDTPSVTREPKNKGVIPRYEGGYSRDELLATKQLKARGWTDTLIKKYLGDPDGTDVTGKYTTNLYSEDRAKQAEKLEPKLMANREKLRQKREDAIREQVNSGVNVFRKVGAKWAVQGNNLKEGEEVTVTKKNGATTTAYITRVFTHADKEYGEIGKKPHGTKRNTSNGTKDTPTVSVDTQPATDRQIKYLLRLLDSHAADYGLNPGQNLMLDSNTVKFPTVEEVQKMSKSEVSYLIDLLLNDAM